MPKKRNVVKNWNIEVVYLKRCAGFLRRNCPRNKASMRVAKMLDNRAEMLERPSRKATPND